jgi:pyruvate/2-oxoglutarate dehydrogenase complex dihydrolipoamide dehydrogenase (E3) component
VSSKDFDVIVLGAGPAGEVCAGRLADNGLSVALVERELVGGECSFYACMPSKALLRPAQALAEARRVGGVRFSEAAGGELDVDAVLRRRDEVVHNLSDDAQLPWIEKREIALVRGHGTLAGEREIRVGDELLHARKAVILAPGTGAGPADSRPARGAPVDEPRGDDREVDPCFAARARRWRRGRGDGLRVCVAGCEGDGRRGAPAADRR